VPARRASAICVDALGNDGPSWLTRLPRILRAALILVGVAGTLLHALPGTPVDENYMPPEAAAALERAQKNKQ
jgi:hypothetical protein